MDVRRFLFQKADGRVCFGDGGGRFQVMPDRAEAVAEGDGKRGLRRRALPEDRALGRIVRGERAAGRGVQQLNVALLRAGGRERQPRLHRRFGRGGLRRGQRQAQRDLGLQAAGGAQLLRRARAQVAGRVGGKAARVERRVDGQRFGKALLVMGFALDKAPVDVAAVHKGVKLGFGKIGHFTPQAFQRRSARVGVVFGQAAHLFGARLQRRLRHGRQAVFGQQRADAALRRRKVSGLIEPFDIVRRPGRQGGQLCIAVHMVSFPGAAAVFT